MTRVVDLTGRRFGKLVVISREGSRQNHSLWLCLCDCGQTVARTRQDLFVTHYSVACRDCARASKAAKHTKHGESIRGKRTKLFNIWLAMLDRCGNPRSRVFRYYGQKGVHVCDEWKTYTVFAAWARSHGYSEGLSIERRDSAGHYEPANCEWITREENSRRSWVALPRRPDGRVMPKAH